MVADRLSELKHGATKDTKTHEDGQQGERKVQVSNVVARARPTVNSSPFSFVRLRALRGFVLQIQLGSIV
jgi:hypothetical protein